MIRSAVKAVITRDGCVLLLRYVQKGGSVFYELPGGGQNEYETMEEAMIRECLEETGLHVKVERFLALHEDIRLNKSLEGTGRAHRILHFFVCSIPDGAEPVISTEPDDMQEGFAWIPLDQLSGLPLRPAVLTEKLPGLLAEKAEAAYLGSTRALLTR